MNSYCDIQNCIYNLPEIKKLRLLSGCKGITYGLSREATNPLRGSHIILITEDEVVLVARSKAKISPIYFFEYKRVITNTIGKKLRSPLKSYISKADINIIRNIPEINIAYKNASGKGRSYGVDPDKALYGSHITLIEPRELLIIRQHRTHRRNKFFHYKKDVTYLGKKVIKILNYYNFSFIVL